MALHIVNIIFHVLLFSLGESTIVNHIQMENFQNPATFQCVANDKASEQQTRSSDTIEFNLNFEVAGLELFFMEFNGPIKCMGEGKADVDCSVIYNSTEAFVKSEGLDVEEDHVQYEIAAMFVCDRKKETLDIGDNKPSQILQKLTGGNAVKVNEEKCVTSSHPSTMIQANEKIGTLCATNHLYMPSSTGEVICSQCCKGWYFDYGYKRCSECAEGWTTPRLGVYLSCSQIISTTTPTPPIQDPTSPQTVFSNDSSTLGTTMTTTRPHTLEPETRPHTLELATDPKTVFFTDSFTLETTKTTSKSTVTTSKTKQEKTTTTEQDNHGICIALGVVFIRVVIVVIVVSVCKKMRLCCFSVNPGDNNPSNDPLLFFHKGSQEDPSPEE